MLERLLDQGDQEQLERFALMAVHRPGPLPEQAEQQSRQWTEQWGHREGDLGVGLEHHGLQAACWMREIEPQIRPGVPQMIIAVDNARRGQGLGGQLLDLMISEAQKEGIEAISLKVSPRNTAAVALYRSRGFKEAGSDDQARIIMVKELSQAPADS